LEASDPTWVGQCPSFPYRCTAKVRYRQEDVSCVVTDGAADHSLVVTFDVPCKAVTPGQSVVFYDGDLCLGGAIIRSTLS